MAAALFMFTDCNKSGSNPVVVPIAPSNLTAIAVSASQINLSWTDNSTNETGFRVERKTSATSYSQLTTLAARVNSYSDTGLTSNTTYTYRVCSFNSAGNSNAFTNEASATTKSTILDTLKMGLVAWYPFTGNANDSSGNNYNGTVNGAILTTDRFGYNYAAYLFNQDTNNITIPTLTETNILTYSVAGWFQKTTTSFNVDGTIFCGSNPCNAPGGLRFYIGNTNQAAWGAEFQSCSSMQLITQNQNYSDSIWHSFVVIFNSQAGLITASQLAIYIDGILVPQTQYSQGNLNNVIAPINNQNLATIIGNVPSKANPFQGKIDDIRVYNRVLTQSEIQYLASH